MTVSIILLLASAGAIYVACEFFVNGIEWVGRRLSLGETATGTVLAAFGTALPESVVTLVATAFGEADAQRQIGIGAALGGPLVLATLAYAVVGLALLRHARGLGRGPACWVQVDHRRLSRDQAWFLAIFAAKIALGLVAFAFKPWLGLLFLGAYALYLWRELEGGKIPVVEPLARTHAPAGRLAEACPVRVKAPIEGGAGSLAFAGSAYPGRSCPDIQSDAGVLDITPLKIRPGDPEPSLGWALLQTLAALAVIFIAARVFVGRLGDMAIGLGLAPQITALLLSPIATELPEMMNALIWVRQGRERLALANISGAMMIQATVPTAFGLFFTPWHLDPALLLSAGATAAAVLYLFLAFRGGLMSGARLAQVGWLYLAFGAGLLWIL
jgi:cation:H+ antiporter